MAERLGDQDARDRIVLEHGRNVVVKAGAGSGKTHTLITRLVELVAPSREGVDPIPLRRIAAISFTRRSAGDLKLQARRRLLMALETAREAPVRRELLRRAIGEMDGAFFGTIHSFALRILQSRPIESGLGPGRELLEDTADLAEETFEELLRSAQLERLSEVLDEELDPARVQEVEKTLELALDAGLPRRTAGTGYGRRFGLDALIAELIDKRDIELDPPLPRAPRLSDLRPEIRSILEEAARLRGASRAVALMQGFALELGQLDEGLQGGDLVIELQRLFEPLADLDKLYAQNPQDFPQDDHRRARGLAVALLDKPLQSGRFASRRLRSELLGPGHAYLACRLMRIAPVVRCLYDRVKRRRAVLDYTDVLLLLARALRDETGFRTEVQALFDHILLDECQDNDPLQVEIISFLAEQGARARHWREVRFRPGALTVVGDPKQSIYRFRRADIAIYEDFTRALEEQGALCEILTCNFRSRPELICEVFNKQGPVLLRRVDRPAGQAEFQDLTPAGNVQPAGDAVVHRIDFAAPAHIRRREARRFEAEAIAAYLDELLRGGLDVEIRDPDCPDEQRAPRPGDVVILCRSTFDLDLLSASLDRRGIAHLKRGGKTSMQDPALRALLLALRAVSDPDDGVAHAALLAPPFFPLSLADELAARSGEACEAHRAAIRLLEALRRRRHERPLLRTASLLMEQSQFARLVSVLPNGRQRLALIRQALALLQSEAARRGLDFDRATALGRCWVERPPRFDPAEPDTVDAVRIFTTHQSKGLEFPIVVLWDAQAGRPSGPRSASALELARDGSQWSLKIGWVHHDSSDGGLAELDGALDRLERDRLYYVATTRTRDLLAIPFLRSPGAGGSYHALLVHQIAAPGVVRIIDLTEIERAAPSMPLPELVPDEPIQQASFESQEAWTAALAESARPRMRPRAPSSRAGAEPDPAPPRYGPDFGTLVHRALELLLSGARERVEDAFEVAFAEQPAGPREEALADVRRAIAALDGLQLRREGMLLLPEYRLAAPRPVEDGSELVAGQMDLLALSGREAWIIDFKTDQDLGPHAHAHYEQQLEQYAYMLRRTGLIGSREIKQALLFTQTGRVHVLGGQLSLPFE
ncbi:MAG: UvrD-helicase domain-containing protein [Deltaproteobacteria bacterium]|nr:UvrD-helicase domain-containing protein [Deltaproteobacteria bacterium]